MVVVASALLVFCVDALVTGQHNRQNAAEQANGARYSLDRPGLGLSGRGGRARGGRPGPPAPVPGGDHGERGRAARRHRPWPWTRRRSPGSPTSAGRVRRRRVAGDRAALRRPVAAHRSTVPATSTREPGHPHRAVAAPDRRPRSGLQLVESDGTMDVKVVCASPRRRLAGPFSTDHPCTDRLHDHGRSRSRQPPGGELQAHAAVVHDLAVDGQPVLVGPPTNWRRVRPRRLDHPAARLPPATSESVWPPAAPAAPPVMVHAWVPRAGPGAGQLTAEERLLRGAGLDGHGRPDGRGQLVAGPRLPAGFAGRGHARGAAAPPRQPPRSTSGVEVWSDDAGRLTGRRPSSEARA